MHRQPARTPKPRSQKSPLNNQRHVKSHLFSVRSWLSALLRPFYNIRMAKDVRNYSMWRLGGLSALELLRLTARESARCNFAARSAQFAYYGMLGLFPLIIFVLAAVTQLPIDGMMQSIDIMLERGLPKEAADVIEVQILDIQKHSSTKLLAISFVVLAFAGTRLFMTLADGLNAAFGVPVRYRRWRSRGLSLLLTAGALGLFLLCLVLLVVGPALTTSLLKLLDLPEANGITFHLVRWTIVIVALLLSTAAIYCWMPRLKLPWHWISPGSVFAVFGWILIGQGFRLYVANFGQYNQTYGALGGVMVLMVWFYLTGSVLLAGGLINSLIYQAAGFHFTEGKDEDLLPALWKTLRGSAPESDET